ncbi:LacI family DNA-binding transcriptional regulator [Arthrobacter sp. NPDC056691]|uniref:LacI family DNA-binding transcriptional regulator n=1 Tax=Arthrobacter sp. NPDC056691 TaxID=3345913 RepID=UPI003670689A
MISTSQDVATRAGVSRSTVSQILNGRAEYFSDETRARVAEAVAELGYEPSVAGRTLARGSSDIVIALIPDTTFGRNLQDIYGLLTEELSSRGLTLVLRLSTRTEASLDRLVVGMKPRAVLTLTALPCGQRELLKRRGVELIEPDESENADVNAKIGMLQARHLIGRGYRKLAYAHLRDARSDPFGGPRERTFVEECRLNGLEEPRILHLDITPQDARSALEELASPGFAVACYNDDVATALLFAATEKEWKIPNDIALIGMDNTPMSRLTVPPLTTMGYDPAIVAQASLLPVLQRLVKQSVSEDMIEVQMDLIQRATT